MEPECSEPLNLVIKKSEQSDEMGSMKSNGLTVAASRLVLEDEEKPEILSASSEGNNSSTGTSSTTSSTIQDALKASETNLPTADHKILTALYMSSLMQMSNLTAPPRGVTPAAAAPYAGQQHNFMQLLAMVEARHRLWQQMNWPLPQGFPRNPLMANVAQPYFDGPGNLAEQLCNSPNSLPAFTPLSSSNPESSNFDAKQTYLKRYSAARVSTSNTCLCCQRFSTIYKYKQSVELS